jgi:hypothetical protein
MKSGLSIQTTIISSLFAVSIFFIFASTPASAETHNISNTSNTSATKSDSINRSIDLFGLKLGQSITEVKSILTNTFKIKKEMIKEGRWFQPEIEGLDVDALTISNIELPLQFKPDSPPISVKLEKLEILFTLKLPISEPRRSASKFIVFWFEKTPELQALVKDYALNKLGKPLIDNEDGYQWCNYISEDKQSCITSCDLSKPDQFCPPNLSIGLMEASSKIYSLAITDYSMDTNTGNALKVLKSKSK